MPSSRHMAAVLTGSLKLWSLARDLHKAKPTVPVSMLSSSTNWNQRITIDRQTDRQIQYFKQSEQTSMDLMLNPEEVGLLLALYRSRQSFSPIQC